MINLKLTIKKITIKKILTIAALFNLTVSHLVSANMLLPASYGFDFENIGTPQSNNRISARSMYLGKWRAQIANKLNPSYFSQLTNTRLDSGFSSYPTSILLDYNSFKIPVFLENNLNSIAGTANSYFSFSSTSLELTPLALVGFQNKSFGLPIGLNNYTLQSSVIQKYYAPGYVFSTGKSSFGVAAVLLQQKFLDDTFGSISIKSSSSNSLVNDTALQNINKGTGYHLSFDQSLPANIDIAFDYRSQIRMTEYDSFGQSYSEGGNFDIPSQYTVSLAMPFFQSSEYNLKKVNISAERINYSGVDTLVHSGYSTDFFQTYYNSVLRQIFKLKDLTVYSIGFEQSIGSHTMLSLDVFSRQQAMATVPVYSNILINDTASVSYKVGVKHQASFGEFNFFTSFANKPLMMGVSDFGRIYNTSVGKHIEGVASWSFKF